MVNELEPIVEQWYAHLDKGQRFFVTALDEDNETVEIQHFDGDVEEFSFDEWRELDIELSEAPENWGGPMDIGDQDDYGTDVTDTTADDWTSDESEFHEENDPKMRESAPYGDETGEGYMEESPLE